MKTPALVSAFLAACTLAGCGGSSSDGVSQPGHTAPTGMWGGSLVSDANQPATLTLTASGGHFAFLCGQIADMTQAVQPSSAGSFSVAGTSKLGFAGSSAQSTRFTGTVTNHVMTVTLSVTPAVGASYTNGPYTVTLGQTAPTFQGACPG